MLRIKKNETIAYALEEINEKFGIPINPPGSTQSRPSDPHTAFLTALKKLQRRCKKGESQSLFSQVYSF